MTFGDILGETNSTLMSSYTRTTSSREIYINHHVHGSARQIFCKSPSFLRTISMNQSPVILPPPLYTFERRVPSRELYTLPSSPFGPLAELEMKGLATKVQKPSS
jgi:hypothetical protein